MLLISRDHPLNGSVSSTIPTSVDESKRLSPAGSIGSRSSSNSRPKSLMTGTRKSLELRVRIELDQNDQCLIPLLDEYTQEEIDSIWFTDSEYHAIKDDIADLVTRLDNAAKEEGDSSSSDSLDEGTLGCVRGIERRTQEGKWQHYQAVKHVVNAVLDEQDRQWDNRLDDVEEIGRISREATEESAQRARARAIKDHKDAVVACEQMDKEGPRPTAAPEQVKKPAAPQCNSPVKRSAPAGRAASIPLPCNSLHLYAHDFRKSAADAEASLIDSDDDESDDDDDDDASIAVSSVVSFEADDVSRADSDCGVTSVATAPGAVDVAKRSASFQAPPLSRSKSTSAVDAPALPSLNRRISTGDRHLHAKVAKWVPQSAQREDFRSVSLRSVVSDSSRRSSMSEKTLSFLGHASEPKKDQENKPVSELAEFRKVKLRPTKRGNLSRSTRSFLEAQQPSN